MLYNEMFFPVKLPLWKNLLYVCMTARLFSMKRFLDRAIKFFEIPMKERQYNYVSSGSSVFGVQNGIQIPVMPL